jgi:hypothetical protein
MLFTIIILIIIKMKKTLFLLTTMALVILCACHSKSLEDKFNSKSYKEDIVALSEKKLLSDSDKVLLTSYIDFNKSDSSAISKSYSDLLSSAKIKEENRITLEKKKKKLNESVTVTVIKKYIYYYRNDKPELYIDIIAENNTDKQLSGFTVKINFKNADGLTFFTDKWPIDKTVNAKSKITDILSAGEYSNSNIDQAKLNKADLSKIKIEYEILALMYDDGTSLSLE